MKGVTVGQPGQVEWIDYAEPKLGAGEMLLAPLACGICTTDVKSVKQGANGATRYALGHELVGRVLAADPGLPWKPGQRVVAAPYVPCGACYYCRHHQPTLCTRLFENSLDPGGLAERIRLPRQLAERGVLRVPEALADAEAALAEPLGCAVKGVEDSHVQAGDSVLIVGDGPMGQICAAVARAYGARPVIVAGMTPHRLELARQVADATVNVETAELRAAVLGLTEGRGADVVIVVVSDGPALEAGLTALRPGGTLNAFAGVSKGTEVRLDLRRLHYEQYHLTGSFGVGPEHMAKALHLMETGAVNAQALVTARFPFQQTADAVAYAANRVGLKAMVIFDGEPEATR